MSISDRARERGEGKWNGQVNGQSFWGSNTHFPSSSCAKWWKMNNKSRLRFRRLRYIKDFILILLITSATIYLSTYYFASYDFSTSESSTFNSWSESELLLSTILLHFTREEFFLYFFLPLNCVWQLKGEAKWKRKNIRKRHIREGRISPLTKDILLIYCIDIHFWPCGLTQREKFDVWSFHVPLNCVYQ